MKKVLAGGAFNLVHPGHVFFLEKARKLGDCLVVVVASDKTVLNRKGFVLMPAEARREVVASLKPVDRAVIGDDNDFFRVVKKEKPSIIALGYDQEMEESVATRLANSCFKCRIVRIKQIGEYKTEKILSSLGKRASR